MVTEIQHNHDLVSVYHDFNKWLSVSCLPLWFEHGVDWNSGGFYEDLNQNNLICDKDFKRLRVTARQIYVFSFAHRAGLGNYIDAIQLGLDHLLHKHRMPNGVFSSKLSLSSQVLDETLSLYDLSFCIFAFAHAYKTLKDDSLEFEAIKLLNFIERNFSHSLSGFHDQLPSTIMRSQDPHMHLFEACLSWVDISENEIFKKTAANIYHVFCNYFYDRKHCCVREYFDQKLSPFEGDYGLIVKPGHQYEWVWLLSEYQSKFQSKFEFTNKLYQSASEHSISPSSHLLNDEIYPSGQPKSQAVRLWPHTEWLKAEVIMDPSGVRIKNAYETLSRFFDCPQPGLWFERWDAKNNCFVSEPSPASSLYHIVLAYEVINDAYNGLGST